MDQVLKGVSEEGKTVIGISKDESMVRFTSGDFILYHPTIEEDPDDVEGALAEINKDTLCVDFTADVKDIKEGVDAVKTVGKGEKGLNINVDSTKKNIVLRVGSGDHSIKYDLSTKEINTEVVGVYAVKEAYLGQFVKLAPKVAIRTAFRGDRVLLEADTGDSVKLHYSVMQSNVTD
jgi:hypothetical protein